MSEHEHEWFFKTDYSQSKPLELVLIQGWECRHCDAMIGSEEIEAVVNNSTVKTIINVVIARRDDDGSHAVD